MGLAAEKICALAGAEKKWIKALVSPIALQLVTLPVWLKFFGEVSIAGFILNLLVLPSVGVVLTGGMAALLLGILSIPAAKLVILPARVLLLFYEYLCSLAGRIRMEYLDRRGAGNMADSGILWLFDHSPVMGQYIKEQLRKKKEVSEETELSEERAEAGCRKLHAIRIISRYFSGSRNPDTGISSNRKSEGDLPGCRTR